MHGYETPYDEYATHGGAAAYAQPSPGDKGPGPDVGLLAGPVAGLLGVAVALGVANLTAAFVRPQASPIIAVGGALTAHAPTALRHLATGKFGANDKNALLLGLSVTIALIAMAFGIFAWRRVSVGVTGMGLLGLVGAVVAITRPQGHVSDAIPSIVGGLAAIAAVIWLNRAGNGRTESEPSAYETADYETPAYGTPAYQPTAYQPDAFEADAYQPDAYQRDAFQPDAFQPDAFQPDAFEPVAYEPPAYETAGYETAGYEAPAQESPAYRFGWSA